MTATFKITVANGGRAKHPVQSWSRNV